MNKENTKELNTSTTDTNKAHGMVGANESKRDTSRVEYQGENDNNINNNSNREDDGNV